MNTCRVLRCDKPVATVHVWDTNPWRRVELGVCAEHGERLGAGEERAYQSDDPEHVTILMGSDVAVVADAFVDGIKVTNLSGVTAPDGAPAMRVVLTTTRQSDGQTEHVEFTLSTKVAAHLSRMLGFGKLMDPNAEP